MLLPSLRKSALCLLLLCFTVALSADVIELRTGQSVECTIFTQNRERIVCRTAPGKTVSLRKGEIRRIRYGTAGKAAAEAAERRRRIAREEAERKREAERQKEEERLRKEESQKAAERKAREAKHPTKTHPDAVGPTPAGALWRSSLVPGWGQIARSDLVRGFAFGGSVLAGLTGAAYARQTHGALRADYDRELVLGFALASASPVLALYQSEVSATAKLSAADKRAGQYRAASAFAALIYLINLVDAYVFTAAPEPTAAFSKAPHFSFRADIESIPATEAAPFAEARLVVSGTVRF